jgi:hypothetical protein
MVHEKKPPIQLEVQRCNSEKLREVALQADPGLDLQTANELKDFP